MDKFLDQPSTSNEIPENAIEEDGKTKTMYEYIDEHGQRVLIEAPSTSYFVDSDGNAIICEENYDEFSHEVVQEEVVGIEENYNDQALMQNEVKNNVYKDLYQPSTVLLTKRSLDDDRAALEVRSGKQKRKLDNIQTEKINKTGSILNRNLSGMKNMFNVVSKSAIKKTDGALKLDEVPEQPSASRNDQVTINSENDIEIGDASDMSPPKLEKHDVTNQDNEDPGHFGEWPLYSKSAIDFKEACEILVGIVDISEDRICKSLPIGYKDDGTFVIDLRSLSTPSAITADGNGKWGAPSGKTRFYSEDKTGNLIRADDGKGHLKEWAIHYAYKIFLKKYDNVLTKNDKNNERGHFIRKIYTASTEDDLDKIVYVIISYSWTGNPWEFGAGLALNPVKVTSKVWIKETSEVKNNMTTLPPMVSAYYEGFTIYSHEPVDFNDACGILLGGTVVESNRKCTSVPSAYRQNGTFVVDMKKMGSNVLELRRDHNGIWGKPSGSNRFYKFAANGDAVRVDKLGKLMDSVDYDVKISCKRYEHPLVDKKFVRKIFVAKGKDKEYFDGSPGLAIITYFWKCDPIVFDPMQKQNAVLSENREFARLQAAAEEDDEYVIASQIDEDEEVEEETQRNIYQDRIQVDRGQKRARYDDIEHNQIVATENVVVPGYSEMKMDVLRREMENQERFSVILDRAESLVSRMEQRFGILEDPHVYHETTSGQPVWSGQEIIEEEVISHEY